MKHEKYTILVAELFSRQREELCIVVLDLIGLKIDGLRVDNDRADHDSVMRNQGGIAALALLRDEIQYGLPGTEILLSSTARRGGGQTSSLNMS